VPSYMLMKLGLFDVFPKLDTTCKVLDIAEVILSGGRSQLRCIIRAETNSCVSISMTFAILNLCEYAQIDTDARADLCAHIHVFANM